MMQQRWVIYGISAFVSSLEQSFTAASNNQPALITEIAALPPWYQVAVYSFVVTVRTWDFAFIDLNAPAPPPPTQRSVSSSGFTTLNTGYVRQSLQLCLVKQARS